MDVTEFAERDPEAVRLGASRTRVLEALQDAGRPLGVQETAELVGLHANTVRFHLDGLVDAGLATRATEERSDPGRPRVVYAAAAVDVPVGHRSYRLLAEILASFLGGMSPEPKKAAADAGRAWGRYLTDRSAPFRKVGAEEAQQRLVDNLVRLGFDPEPVADGPRREILLHHCPFREIARAHPDVVCGVHLGLMQGMLAEMNTDLAAERLDPFVQPALCRTLLQIGPRPADED